MMYIKKDMLELIVTGYNMKFKLTTSNQLPVTGYYDLTITLIHLISYEDIY